MATLRWGVAAAVPYHAERICRRFDLPKTDSDRIRDLLLPFAERVERGERSLGEAFAVMRAFDAGPVHAAIVLTGFESRFLASGAVGVFSSGSETMHGSSPSTKPPNAESADLPEDEVNRLLGAGPAIIARLAGVVRRGAMAPRAFADVVLPLTETREVVIPTDSFLIHREMVRALRRTMGRRELARVLRHLEQASLANVPEEGSMRAEPVDPAAEVAVLLRGVGE
jgi:hypothetical protein